LFFLLRQRNEPKKAAGKKASFISVGAVMGRHCYCSARLIDSDEFYDCIEGEKGVLI